MKVFGVLKRHLCFDSVDDFSLKLGLESSIETAFCEVRSFCFASPATSFATNPQAVHFAILQQTCALPIARDGN